jgi:hypothetical protein
MTKMSGIPVAVSESAWNRFARVRGLDRRRQELKKRARLWCEVLARGIVGIQGETFFLPIWKEGHQSSTREMGVHTEFEDLGDPIAGQAHRVHRCDVGQRELALRLNLNLPSTFTECPLEGTTRLRVSKIDHPMSFRDQLLWVGRVTVFLQVAGRGYGKNSRVQQSSGDKSGWARLAKTNSQIVSIRDQIPEAVPGDQVYFKFRICFEKSTELRSENELREVRVHVDAESSPDGHFAFGQSGGGVFERRDNRSNGLVKPPAFVCEGDGACRPLQESDSNLRLEPSHCTADARLGDVQGSRGGREAARSHHGCKGAHAIQNAVIETHAPMLNGYK